MQLYARRHPSEVAGLVLVDWTHPTSFEGASALQNRSLLTRAVLGTALYGNTKQEFDALDQTDQEVLVARPGSAMTPISGGGIVAVSKPY